MSVLKRLLAGSLVFALFSQTAFAGTFWIDTNSDADNNTCVEDETTNNDNCTLRDAISQLTSSDTIRFVDNENQTITFGGTTYTMSVNGVTLDAVTGTAHIVAIDGNSSANNGFSVTGDNIIIKGLYLYNFDGHATDTRAIDIASTADSTTIDQNIIGLQTDGTTINANTKGIVTDGNDTNITNNTVSGSTQIGILLGPSATDITITGNKIGTDTVGNTAKANLEGIAFGTGGLTATLNGGNGGVEGVVIGGGTSSLRNVISGNSDDGIRIGNSTTDALNGTIKIQGNYIGVGANGTTAVSNVYGVVVLGDVTGGSASLLIGTDGDGTTDSAEANIISNNTVDGIKTMGTLTNFTVAGNTIKSNTGDGILINSDSVSGTITIGGDDTANAERNIIGSNGDEGVEIADAGSSPAAVTIRNNYIGVDSDGSTARANTGNGIEIADGAALNIVDNTVANSGGVLISGGTSLTFTGNKVGTTSAGTSPAGNTGGLAITATTLTSVVIGGITAALSNIFAASTTGAGISITGLAANDTAVTIQGNYVGVCANTSTGEIMTGNLSTCKNGTTSGGIGMDLQKGAITIGGDNSLAAAGTGTIAAGNVISNNRGSGIKLSGNVSSATIYGNIIGLIRTGAAGVFNVAAGNDTNSGGNAAVKVDSSVITSLIFGAVGSSEATSKKNVVASNNNDALAVTDMGASATATVKNNNFGTDWLGATAKGNGANGIWFADGATINIGGTGTNEGNLSSANTGNGVYLTGTVGTVNVYGNTIGLSADKTADLGNTGHGISLSGTTTNSTTTNIGSTTSGGTNYISGNNGDGINFVSSTNTTTLNILSNIIGLNGAGTAAIANSDGIDLGNASATVNIGDGTTAGRNVVSGNTADGMGLDAGTFSVKGNYVGVGSNGSTVINNGNKSIIVTNTSGSVPSITVGGSGDNKNKISNSSAIGLYLTDITASNESTLDTDNTWTVTTSPTYNFWQRLVASVLTAYGPRQCYDGLDNDNDGVTDYPSDSDCSGYTDSTESGTSNSGGGSALPSGGGGGGHRDRDEEEEDDNNDNDDGDEEEDDSGDEGTEIVVVDDAIDDDTDHDDTTIDVIDTDTDVGVTSDNTVTESLNDTISTTKTVIVGGGFVGKKKKVKDIAVYLDEYEQAKAEIEEVPLTEDQEIIFSALDNTDNETKLSTAKNVIEKGLKQAVSKELSECGKPIQLFGEEIEVDENTDVDFYWSVEEARQSYNDGEDKRTKRLSYHPSTDSNRDGVADVLALMDNRNVLTDCDISLNDQFFFTGNLYKIYMAYQDMLPEIPRITNLNNPYNPKEPVTVGSQVMLWVGGRNIGEDIDVFVVDAETLQEYNAGEIELDKRNRASYLLDFEEVVEDFGGEQRRMYIVVQNKDGEGSIEEVIVDPNLELEAESVHLIRGRVVSVKDAQEAKNESFNESLYTTVLLASKSVEAQEGDEPYILTGYAEPGSMVYVTWKSLTYSSVALADASQGYFEIEAPEELDDGDHEVITYVYDRKKNFVSTITQLLFSK